MDLDNLITFCSVAHYKSFKKAAQSLQVTQPGISRRIQSLENELGISLFVRTPQSVTLTQSGKHFLPYAERTIQIFTEGKNKILDKAHDEKLAVAAPPTTSVNLLPEVIRKFSMHHKGTRVSVYTVHSQHVFDMLIDKTIDVGFTTVVFPGSVLNYDLVYTEEVLCVGHPDLVEQYMINHEIVNSPLPFIMTNLNNIDIHPWDSVNRFVLNNPLFNIVVDAFFLHIVERLARNGVGFAVLPISHVQEGIEKGELVQVSIPGLHIPPRPVYIATHKEDKMKASVRQFIETARSVFTSDFTKRGRISVARKTAALFY